jgi:hypothetical protein
MIFEPIRVITRPKRNAIGTHFGVHFPNGIVYDYTYEAGFRQVTLDEFTDNLPITVAREIPWQMAYIVKRRLHEVIRNPRKYHLLAWNCETFAEWLTSGVARSRQVVGALLLLGLAVAVAFNSR